MQTNLLHKFKNMLTMHLLQTASICLTRENEKGFAFTCALVVVHVRAPVKGLGFHHSRAATV
jgi:hypothetical protein